MFRTKDRDEQRKEAIGKKKVERIASERKDLEEKLLKLDKEQEHLMSDPKMEKLIKELDENLDVPVTAKIRVYDDLEKSIEYAKMVEKAGAQIIAVHGRTREQKRLAEFKCNW